MTDNFPPSSQMARLLTIQADLLSLLEERFEMSAIIDKFYEEVRLDPDLWHTERRKARLHQLVNDAIDWDGDVHANCGR